MVGILIAAAIFYLDLLLPLGVAESALYVSLVLIGLRTRSKNFILWSAIGGTALILIGFYLSPEGGELWKVLANRALSTFILWLTAILCLWQIRAETKLQEASEKLEKRVEDRTIKLDEANELLRRESGFVELHKDIAVASNETRTIENTMEYCLKRICAHTGWPVGHLYLTSERYSLQLVPAGIWHLEDPTRFETFRKVARGGKYASPRITEKLAFDFSDTDKPLHETLSDREYQVFGMIANGISLTDIGKQLSLSVKTISTHRTRILDKMKMKKNAELIRYAINNNLS